MKSTRLKILIAITVILVLRTPLFSQSKTNIDFNYLVDSVLIKKPQSYSDLQNLFKEDLQDSLKMKFLALKSKESNYSEGESFALCKMGVIYRDLSLNDRAISFHQNAINIASSGKNVELQVVNLNMLGLVYNRIKDIKNALSSHRKALTLGESQESITVGLKKSIAVSCNSIGNIYLILGNTDLALEYLTKSLKIEGELRNKLGLAINYQNIGAVLEEMDNFDQALVNYQRALQYNQEINSLEGKVICYNSIGQIYLKSGFPIESVNILEQNLSLAIENKSPYYIASTYIGLGWAHLELNKLEEAEFNLIKGLKIAEESKLQRFIASANIHLSKLYEKKGDYKLALEKYIISDKIYHLINSDNNQEYITALNIQYNTEKKNNKIEQLAKENELKDLKIKEDERNQLVVLFGMLIVAGIYFIFNRQRRLKNEKKIITLEQDMLRSQMNPHFIFNSLNSIKLYIINNEKENAVYYLNKFSKLIRKILMASKEKEITLAEELETMELYMNIENIRFSNEINYNTKIANSVDLQAIKVPSLILQPFLENALWHGLSTKKDDKHISLEVNNENGTFVVISISDNGIGRAKAEKIKSGKSLERKSVGLAITEDRLSNFYKGYNTDYKIEIKDLYDNKGNALGTQVIITIPLEKAFKLRTA